MNIRTRLCSLAAAFVLGATATLAQQSPGVASGNVSLHVVVSQRSGTPVTSLQQGDFTLSDNGSSTPITSFKAVSATQEPVRVILLIDAVNTDFQRVAYVRDEVQKYLKENGGRLAHPTTIAVLTDKGTEIEKGFSADGNVLSASLDKYTIGLREITRASGIWGANDRVQISLTAVQQLAAYASTIPGRKVVLWVSPGWPLLSGTRIELDSKQQAQIFANVVAFSKELQQSNLTLYSINPLGAEEDLFHANYYEMFLRGVKNPRQTDLADLSLQVLAVQSGGLALNGSSDVSGNLDKCLVDTESWYEIGFAPQIAEQRNEYHHVQVVVDKQGLVARTRDGYYAQPR